MTARETVQAAVRALRYGVTGTPARAADAPGVVFDAAAVRAALPGDPGKPTVLGIEVTDPAVAEVLKGPLSPGNVDPQHGFHLLAQDNGSGYFEWPLPPPLATDAAVSFASRLTAFRQRYEGLPPVHPSTLGVTPGALLLTTRPDLDSVATMALFALLVADVPVASAEILISDVALADSFSPGEDWQPAELPTPEQPWAKRGSVDGRQHLAAINRAVQDVQVPLEQRVEWAALWLLTGEEPASYRRRVDQARQALIAAVADGALSGDSRIAVVRTAIEGVTAIGYCQAPRVAAQNPETGKVTLAWWRAGLVDRQRLLAALNAREAQLGGAPKWGGGLTIVGSPQHEGTRIPFAEIVGFLRDASVE